MLNDYRTWAEHVERFTRALSALEPFAQRVDVASPAGEPWYELLTAKLAPQVRCEPRLIVAVVGGTNIGKSALFNQLAGERASGVSPLAAGTKHPVCLVPGEWSDEPQLARWFERFVLRPWSSPDDPLSDSKENVLFWREGRHVPPRLLLLDTPDVDSDVEVNWHRAEAIRDTADLLIAVLTQQKYNDAAVKRFFRLAAEADKPVIVIFNQCDLEADRDYWRQWLATFTTATGADPQLVYVVPYDRAAADQMSLTFYRLDDATRTELEPASLADDLSKLHFDAIKIRAFRGALAQVVDRETGADAYLARLRGAAAEFATAAEALSAAQVERVTWPMLPGAVLVGEIRSWWDANRQPWSRRIHSFYRQLGQVVAWPARKAWRAVGSPADDPLRAFHQNEREAVVGAVPKLLDELERLARVGSDLLRPRLRALVDGRSREHLLERVRAAHESLPSVDGAYRAFLRDELDRWGSENPRAVALLRSLDHVTAIARPAITVTLVFSGWALAGDVMGHAVAHAAGHTAGELATEVALAGGIAGGAEAAVSVTGEGVAQASARLFRRLQTGYAQHRARWLAEWLEKELLGDLLTELRGGAQLSSHPSYLEAVEALGALRAASVKRS